MRLVVVIDGPPVPKARPRFNGHAFTPKRTREYEKSVKEALRNAASQLGWPLDKTYRVNVAVYRARRAGDLDNFVKAITDSANGVLYDDDRQIVEIHGLLFDDKDHPRVMVDVEVV